MSTFRKITNVFRLFGRWLGGIKRFFVKWFLPAPAVDSMDTHNSRWNFDEDENAAVAPPALAAPEQSAGAPQPPAPEVRPPEADEDRQPRTQMPNPFA